VAITTVENKRESRQAAKPPREEMGSERESHQRTL
jgi:hypothetical protein